MPHAQAGIADPDQAKASARLWLGGEFLLIFVLPPMLCALRVWPLNPLLLLAPVGVAAVAWHITTLPDRRQLLLLPDARRNLTSIAVLFASLATTLVLLLAITMPPDRLFWLPRHRPGIWLMLLFLYPVLSVIPQELLFRAFLFRRYAPLFSTPARLLAASVIAFALVHVVFGNWIAPVLTIPGGIIFGVRYQRTGSLILTSIEHALWGVLMFSVGLERYFVTAAARFITSN